LSSSANISTVARNRATSPAPMRAPRVRSCSGIRPGSTSHRNEASPRARGLNRPCRNALASARSVRHSPATFSVAWAAPSG
jgi:hypothetical protein